MKRRELGGTLPELLTTVVIAACFLGLVGSAMTGLNAIWQSVMTYNPSLAEHRRMLDNVAEHVRNAQGCRNTASAYNSQAVVAATSTSVTYIADKDSCSTIRYYLSGTDLMRQVGTATPTRVASDITSMTLSYLKSNSYNSPWSSTTVATTPGSTELNLLSGVKLHLVSNVNGQSITSDVTIRLRNSPQKKSLDGL